MKKLFNTKRFLLVLTLALLMISSYGMQETHATYSHPENAVVNSDFEVTGTTGWEYKIAQKTMMKTDGSSTTMHIKVRPGTNNLDYINLKVYMRYGSSAGDISLINTIDLKSAFQAGYISHASGSIFTVTVPTDDGAGYPVEFGLNLGDTDSGSYSIAYGNDVLDTVYMSFVDPDLDVTAPVIENEGVYYTDYDNLDPLTSIQETVTAVDETDGPLPTTVETDNYTGLVTAPGDYNITFKATDSAGNSSTTTVIVRVVDITKPVVTIDGSSNINIEYNGIYTEHGANWTDNVDGSGSNVVIAGDTVNTAILGTYNVTYSYTDTAGNTSDLKTRTVNVVDTTKPVIDLVGGNVTVEHGDIYTEQGATWTDNYDGTGSNVIIGGDVVDTSTVGTYTVTYNYTDTNGNAATQVSRTVSVVDTVKPVITLNGSSSVTLEHGDLYTEQGATWTDNADGTGSNVTISGIVDTSTVGTYTVTYNFTDSSGNIANEVTRTVTVIDNTSPVFSGFENLTTTFTSSDNLTDILSVVTAHDDYDGNLTSSIVIVSEDFTGNEHVVGTYNITIEVTDSNNNTTSQSFTIQVLDDYPPVITYSDYLVPVEEANQMTQQEIIDWINNRS